jgi:predicted nucleic acid-binding Zn ribbon protein
MKCPNCGKTNEEDSTFCSNCGTPLKEKSQKKINKKILVVLVVAVVAVILVVVAFTVFRYDTGEANDLVDLANNEVSKANDLLDTIVSPKLSEFEKVNIDIESDKIDAEIQKVTAWKNDALQLKSTVATVSDHLKKAKRYYQETDTLRLSEWYHEYIALKVKALDKDLERMSTMQLLLDNYMVYYGFSEYYLKGEQEFVGVLDDLEAGNTKLDQGDYSGAADMYRDALEGLRDGRMEYTSAGDVIDLSYLEDLDEYLGHLDTALDLLVDAAEFLGIGNIFQANTVLDEVNESLEDLSGVSEDMLKDQLDSWYDTHIQGLVQEIESLAEDVSDLEQDAQNVYEQNT